MKGLQERQEHPRADAAPSCVVGHWIRLRIGFYLCSV